MVISHSYVTNYQRVCCLIWKWVASGEVSFGFTSLVVPAAPWIWAYHLAKLGEVNTGFPWISFQTIWNCQPKGTRAPEKPPPLRQSFLLSFRGQTIQAIVWQEATRPSGHFPVGKDWCYGVVLRNVLFRDGVKIPTQTHVAWWPDLHVFRKWTMDYPLHWITIFRFDGTLGIFSSDFCQAPRWGSTFCEPPQPRPVPGHPTSRSGMDGVGSNGVSVTSQAKW